MIAMLVNCGVSNGNMYGFTVQNWKAKILDFVVNVTHMGQRFTLVEDSYAYDTKEQVACVADGIRRDFYDGSVAYVSPKNLIKFLDLQYPSPSYAREVADICASKFLETKSLEEVNKAIKPYNSSRFKKTDYLANDLAGCTAAGVFRLEDGNLCWSSINAAGVAIIDKKGNLKFKTIDDGEHSFEKNPYLEKILSQHGGFNNPDGRRMIRSRYRNNPEEPLAYGALTGEDTALKYIHQGIEEVKTGEFVLLFTDGIRELLFPRDEQGKEKVKIIDEYLAKILKGDARGLERLCRQNVSTDGTLIVWNVK
jgi:hypothetical protein